MRTKLLPAAAGLILFAVVMRSLPTPLEACAPAPPPNVKVEIASESAIIIWDEKTKTEHFIRRATFNTPAKDFGFLVPTPTEPTLEEVDDQAFTVLAKITEPRVVKEPRQTGGGGCGIGCGGSAPRAGDKSAAGSVEVLQEKDVGGYKAAVLKATDADKLAAWLKENGYESRPALTRWLEKYVAENYIIAAFKIAKKEEKSEGVSSAAVRMSFTAPKPFFPYREPHDMGDAKGKRLLRVFYIGSQKAIGTIGEKGEWPGKIAWANKLSAENWQQLDPLLKMPGFNPPEGAWLTEFEDTSSPRPGKDDLFFATHPDQMSVERPAHIVYTNAASSAALPTYVCCAALLLAFYLVRWLRPSLPLAT